MTDTHQAASADFSSQLAVSQDFIVKDEHPMLQIPFSVQIDDRRYEGQSISITHALISGLTARSAKQEPCHAVLRFDFDGFSINLFVVASLEKIGSSESPDHKLRFCDPSGAHLAPLRYIINSSLAGDLVTMDRIIGYSGPTQEKKKAQAPRASLFGSLGRLIRHGVMLVLSLLLFAFAGNVLMERIVFNYEARPVLITASGQVLRATASGQVTYVNEVARQGDVLYSIGANSGDLLSFRMPCDCEIAPFAELSNGATVLAGTPLVKLTQPNAGLEATTDISFKGASRYLSGDQAELELQDGTIVPITLELVQSASDAANSATTPANIALPIAAAEQLQAGQTVRLRFRRAIPYQDQIQSITQIARAWISDTF